MSGWWSIVPIIGDIIDRVIPDKEAAARAKRELEVLEQKGELGLLLEQIEVNKVEAGHRSVFVAGWRPFIGWSCGFIFVYHGIVVHIVEFIAALNGVDVGTLPKFDIGVFTSVLLGLLGLGGLRTYEKFKGVNNR